MTTLTGNQIDMARLLALRAMLKLELRGLPRSRAPSAYSMLKKMGYKGTRQEVLAQLDVVRNEMLGETI
jgi:hypothetical protein